MARKSQPEPESVIEMKLKLIRAQIMYIEDLQESMNKATHEKLDMIISLQQKTNGSVIELQGDVKILQDKTHELELADAKHVSICPQDKRIEEIEEDLLEYKFFKRNSWFIWMGIAAVVVVVFIGIYETFLKN